MNSFKSELFTEEFNNKVLEQVKNIVQKVSEKKRYINLHYFDDTEKWGIGVSKKYLSNVVHVFSSCYRHNYGRKNIDEIARLLTDALTTRLKDKLVMAGILPADHEIMCFLKELQALSEKHNIILELKPVESARIKRVNNDDIKENKGYSIEVRGDDYYNLKWIEHGDYYSINGNKGNNMYVKEYKGTNNAKSV